MAVTGRKGGFINITEWNENTIEVFQHLATRASGFRWLHNESAYHYRHINNRFVYSTIFISSLASVGSFIAAGRDGSGFVSFMNYTIGGLNIVLGMIASVQRFMTCAEKSQAHAIQGKAYSSLVRTIQTEIILKRYPPNELLMDVSNDYERLGGGLHVPHKIIAAFLKKFPNVKQKPEIATGVFHINEENAAGWSRLFSLIKPQMRSSNKSELAEMGVDELLTRTPTMFSLQSLSPIVTLSSQTSFSNIV